MTWIDGALDVPAALNRLVAGADAVIHVAGVVNAPDRAGFAKGNIEGTRAIVAAATGAGVDRFIHVSSLAAREPDLSAYGWSKAGAEKEVSGSTLDWTMLRPPAVYGPGDLDMLDIFRFAKRGIALLPPPGKLSLIVVTDLARLLLALATTSGHGETFEADDGKEGGWTHADFAQAIGTAVGQRVMLLPLPKPLLWIAARIDGLVRGKRAKLTPDRVGYMCHPDWTIDPARRPPPALWTAQVATPEGLADTVAWYRARGLL